MDMTRWHTVNEIISEIKSNEKACVKLCSEYCYELAFARIIASLVLLRDAAMKNSFSALELAEMAGAIQNMEEAYNKAVEDKFARINLSKGLFL